MDNVSARPAVAAPPPPPAQDVKPQAAKTELTPAKVVTSTEKGLKSNGIETGAKQASGQRNASANKSLSIDAETNSVILKKTDTDTGEILEQYPTESTLGLRTYAREQISVPGETKAVA